MTPEHIINHFSLFEPRSRAYLTVRALEIAGFSVDTNLNLAILAGRL